MIKAFSQKLMPPFSGQVQIAESDTFRALTLDGLIWEIQYVKRSHIRVGTLTAREIKTRSFNSEKLVEDAADPKLIELLDYLRGVKLPFSSTDFFEYWLLDKQNQEPLALLFACSQSEQMSKFPSRAEWTALPEAVMPIKKTDEELSAGNPPINYQFERLVAEQAGTNSKAQWFDRREQHTVSFPALLVKEDWQDANHSSICQRYLERQAPRLLMLHGLSANQRDKLEQCCSPQASEVGRFCGLYPTTVNDELMRSLRVEARLREASNSGTQSNIHKRRDGVLYM